jgi:hypothetical protein
MPAEAAQDKRATVIEDATGPFWQGRPRAGSTPGLTFCGNWADPGPKGR